ncbi:MAG: dTMP kinase [Alphaproteobacteria bacterium]|nr:dTMP kinase [Alphaproteobacteria bacterium]
MTDSKGFFLTFEGGEGAGKSTQISLLRDFLASKGIDVVLTREPGGSAGAEAIRELLLNGAEDKWDPVSEVLLFSAARRNHLQTKVFPALSAGKWVLCDRFADSTMAYQGYAYGEKSVPLSDIEALYKIAAGDFQPDLTFILDIPVEEGLKRVEARSEAITRFEQMKLDFHKKLRSAYVNIADANPERCVLINAADTKERIHERIVSLVMQRLF